MSDLPSPSIDFYHQSFLVGDVCMLMRVGLFIALICLPMVPLAQSADASAHAEGLSQAMRERIRFNDFLGFLFPPFTQGLTLSAEELSKVKDTALERRKSYEAVLAKLNPEWKDASESEREKLIQELVAQDQVFVEQQLKALNESLPPATLNGLFRKFIRLNTAQLFDPVVVEHLALTPAEIRNMRARMDEAQKFIESVKWRTGLTSDPLPADPNREYHLLCERVWAELPAHKLVNCFRVMGMIGEEDELADAMIYWTDRAEYLYSEVPAIANSWDLRKRSESSLRQSEVTGTRE